MTCHYTAFQMFIIFCYRDKDLIQICNFSNSKFQLLCWQNYNEKAGVISMHLSWNIKTLESVKLTLQRLEKNKHQNSIKMILKMKYHCRIAISL